MNIKPTKEKLWNLIERYRQSGGREEHWRNRDLLDIAIDELVNAQQAQSSAPDGFALVPIIMTPAMEEVTTQEDWQWGELLAAANAVTEKQYEAAMNPRSAPEPELPVAVDHISDPDSFDPYDSIPVYTAAQMHAHYQAGVSAGRAQKEAGNGL